MRWLGTALGGTLGLAFGGPVGALFGAALGQGVDRGWIGGALRPGISAEERLQIQQHFFEATFQIMGHLAKADGRVSEAEITHAESVMERMALSPPQRRTAIRLFNAGKSADFDPEPVLKRLKAVCAGQGALLHLFLEVQLSTAHVDGPPSSVQRAYLERMRHSLGISRATYRRIEMLAALQVRVRAAAGRAQRPGSVARADPPLSRAYATLGVEPRASDAEIKRAYRRLMSQHHPDKLVSQGLPEEALRMASQKTQEIRRAYEAINRARTA